MATNEPPIGKPFSRVYLEPGKPTHDSDRFRSRLAAFFDQFVKLSSDRALARLIHRELGVAVQSDHEGGFLWAHFFETAQIADLLSSLTFTWMALTGDRQIEAAEKWLRFVRRVLLEENVSYRVDEACGVHFLVDEEFERSRVATLAILGRPGYAAVLKEFDDAYRSLDRDPPDGKTAIKATFEAVEILFKLVCHDKQVERLSSNEIAKHLGSKVTSLYAGNAPASSAANQMLASFGNWVNAAHNYRHGQKTEEVVQPPAELAIAMLSSGASFLRWLAEIDTAVKT
jgi:hypothetical protein